MWFSSVVRSKTIQEIVSWTRINYTRKLNKGFSWKFSVEEGGTKGKKEGGTFLLRCQQESWGLKLCMQLNFSYYKILSYTFLYFYHILLKLYNDDIIELYYFNIELCYQKFKWWFLIFLVYNFIIADLYHVIMNIVYYYNIILWYDGILLEVLYFCCYLIIYTIYGKNKIQHVPQ